ncbi:OmpH family outer membrane protein [Thiomonas sp.]|jgi:outer membrane protein|uniref:OmpH family outer membrane protein n=1 Tax=Thiomonas sp. TaxID=2047785 RepID=UPI00262148D1|nr:OmpH family outer membrane protein [Thiomonas sp.]
MVRSLLPIRLAPKALLCAALLGCAGLAHAASAPARVGYIDIERVLQESAPARQEAQQLRQEFLPRSQKIKAMEQDLAAQKAKLQENSLVMSNDQRIAAQTRITELAQHIQDAKQAFNEDLDTQRSADIQSLLKRTRLVVDRIAVQRHLDAVFQSAVYIDPHLDLTNAVIQALAQPASGKDARP